MKFLIKFVLILVVWVVFYSQFVTSSFFYKKYILETLAKCSSAFLGVFGVDTEISGYAGGEFMNSINVLNSPAVQVGEGCDGLSLLVVFLVFISVYPGSYKNKTWFIPLGILLISLLNIIRISVLAYMMSSAPDWLDFNHKYTFQIITYGFIFLLWFVWVKKFAPRDN